MGTSGLCLIWTESHVITTFSSSSASGRLSLGTHLNSQCRALGCWIKYSWETLTGSIWFPMKHCLPHPVQPRILKAEPSAHKAAETCFLRKRFELCTLVPGIALTLNSIPLPSQLESLALLCLPFLTPYSLKWLITNCCWLPCFCSLISLRTRSLISF